LSRATAAVFLAALAARVAFGQIADQPLLYTHQYHYFTNALRIAEHPDALRYVAASDEWRTWDGHWTIAPLYHLFLAGVFTLLGPALGPLRLVQCALDALAAAAVAALGQRVAGPRGAWAGLAYAVYWPAMEMPNWTLTENVHTPLFVGGIALLASDPGPRRSVAAGVLLGLSALARSVSTGFVALAAAWRWWQGGRRGLALGALLAAGGAAVVLPWTARNVFVIGDPVLIESAAFENLWWANHLTDPVRFRRQQEVVHSQATPAEKRAAALHFALRGPRRTPGLFVEKVRVNFWHLFRPEGLHNLVRVERSISPWRHAGSVILDDLPLLLALPLFGAFLAGGRPSPARALIAIWTAYYAFMIVVVFHNEIRYRSALMPFVFAGAAGAVASGADAGRRARLGIGFALGLAVSALSVWPYAGGAVRAVSAWRAVRPAIEAAYDGRIVEARPLAEAASARDPRSPRPWADFARALGLTGQAGEAAAAYDRAARLANYANWRPAAGLARYAPADARGVPALDRASWDADPWLVLEAAWREVPAPLTDEVLLARNDYGAVRGFLHPRGLDPMLSAHRLEWARYEPPGEAPPPGAHRWSLHRAWIRLMPLAGAGAYDVTLDMGSPFPSPLASPTVVVTANDRVAHRRTLDRTVRGHAFRVDLRAGEPLVVRLDAPAWCRLGEPADQGVRVDRMSVRRAR
jgi:hypothetical protein